MSGLDRGLRRDEFFAAQTRRRIVGSVVLVAHGRHRPIVRFRNAGEHPGKEGAADAPAHDADLYVVLGVVSLDD